MRIGRFVLHPDTGVLRSGADQQRLTAKALQVLLVLVDANGAAVSRDDILHKVWGDHYPTDSVVSRAVADLRQAFGESAGDSRTIRTIPKFGYQLTAPAGPVDSIPERQGTVRWVLAASAVLVVLLIATSLREAPAPAVEDPAALTLAKPEPLTSAPGLEHVPRVVPGTDWVVYAALRPERGDWDLFRISVTESNTQAIAASQGVTEHGAAVSPDGETVAYVRLDASGCWVVVQPIVLGKPEPLVACTARFPTLVDWSPDGALIAYTAAEANDPDGFRRIHVFDRDTGASRAVSVHVSATGSDFYPRFSPSGRKLAFLRGEPHPDHRSSLWVVDVVSRKELRITGRPGQLGGMTWLDEDHLLYAINEAGRFDLRRHRVSDGRWQLLDSGDRVHPEYDRVNKRLLMASLRSERDLIAVRTDGSILPVASSTSDDHHGSWSPNARFVVFVSRRSGHDELWLTSIDDGSTRRLTHFDGATVRYPSWHPDGQRVLFTAQADGAEQLYEANLISGEVRPLEVQQATVTTPAWLPGGRRFLFGCGDSRADGICLGDTLNSSRLVDNLYRPTAVGKDSFIAADRQGRLWKVGMTDAARQSVDATLPVNGRFAWDVADGTLVYGVSSGRANAGRIVRRDLSSGEESTLWEGVLPLVDGSLDLGSNGHVLATRFDAASDDLVVVPARLGVVASE